MRSNHNPVPVISIEIEIDDPKRYVIATYRSGAARIQLWLGRAPSQPQVEISVWDHLTSRPTIRPTLSDVRARVEEWISESDSEYPEWYDDFIRGTS